MTGQRFLAVAAIPFIAIEVLGITMIASLVARHLNPSLKRIPSITVGALLVLTSLLPFIDSSTPIWSIGGFADSPLIDAGSPAGFIALSAGMPATLRCVKQGELIATSEIGYLGFARLDLQILDVRGLTNRVIARGSPASIKGVHGVTDLDWYKATSPVGKVLLAREPAVIAELDSLPHAFVLDRQYRLVKETTERGVTMGFYVPRNAKGICSA
jgi:hypothetical protein